MSNRLRNKNDRVYDKFQEHMDQSPLGKIQQQYWTARQLVLKKLGKKEDEFVMLSDAELDAKLELFEAIEISSMDLLRVIDVYQEKLLDLSIEENEMSTFLKSESTYDTKTKAGKIMAAVSKAQHFAAQQRNTLRLPLVRLFNEVETFRMRAVSDTFLTIRKMEKARTEYRGALLWMKNVSQELDPDASRKLEKFRQVQAQVKKTKTKFDRLKLDVTQKVDMLSASRCNMFSYVLVNYQKALIHFWKKTAHTFGAVAEAFKGCDHYEFNIIKDLVEPSKRQDKELSNISLNSNNESFLDQSITSINDNKDRLVDLGEQINDDIRSVERVNELIDLMTLNEATDLSEQMKELAVLEQEKQTRLLQQLAPVTASSKLVEFGAFVTSKIQAEPSLVDLTEPDNSLASQIGLDKILSNVGDEFEREWQSALENKGFMRSPNLVESREFNLFSQISDGETLVKAEDEQTSEFLFEVSKCSDSNVGEKKNLSAWFDLFAELDPLKNPDEIGQKDGTANEQRNC